MKWGRLTKTIRPRKRSRGVSGIVRSKRKGTKGLARREKGEKSRRVCDEMLRLASFCPGGAARPPIDKLSGDLD
jgi:hypothetical protein